VSRQDRFVLHGDRSGSFEKVGRMGKVHLDLTTSRRIKLPIGVSHDVELFGDVPR
jgi:hypothetical protein